MKVTLDHTEEIAGNIMTFWFAPEKPMRYTAGQFSEVTLKHENADKRGQKRWFTLSSSPSEDLISITTKFAVENGSSFKAALRAMNPGDQVEMSDPMGDFVLPKDQEAELVFIAGGIGVTPMRSMIKWLTDSHEMRTVKVLYAANKPAEIAFRDTFEAYGASFLATVNAPDDDWNGETGFLTPERVFDFAGQSENQYLFLSGPEPMIEALVGGLKDKGYNKKRIVTDYFPGYVEV